MKGRLRGAILENASLKLVSFILAITLFALVRGEREAVVAAVVAVDYVDPPAGRVLVSEPVETVRVLVKGPWTQIKRFDERSVPPVEVPLGGITAGEFAIQADLIRLPAGLEVVSVSPRSVRVLFEPVVERAVPVSARVVGVPTAGWQVGDVTVIPPSIVVRGASSMIGALSALELSPVSVEGQALEVVEWARVVGLPIGAEVDGDPMVEVRVTLIEDIVERRLGGVGVVASDAIDVDRDFSPREVQVVLRGERQALERLRPARLRALLAAPEGGRSRPGGPRAIQLVPIQRVDGLPAGVELIEIVPPEVALRPRARAKTSAP